MAEQQNFSGMLSVGTVLHDTFRIDRYLSSGGFGNTYVATNLNFNEVVAIKEFFMKGVNQRNGDSVSVSVSNDENLHTFESQKKKFKKEAQRLHALHNEHIVHVHDLFEENGTIYYVMDYIDGISLRDKMRSLGHPMPENEVLDILKQVLDALAEVHKLHIYHLDLKPANIMLNKHNVAVVIDFGASKQLSSDDNASTSTGVSYTEGYAPTEQIERNFEKIGPWTDFYALGATIYNLLSNRKPSRSSDVIDDDTPDKHISLPMPSTVSKAMRNLVLWMMQGKRSKRPQSVKEIQDYIDKNFGNNNSSAEDINRSKKDSDAGDDTVIGEVTDYEATVLPEDKRKEPVQKEEPVRSKEPVQREEPEGPKPSVQQVEGKDNSNKERNKTLKYCIVAAVIVAVIVFAWKQFSKGGSQNQTNSEDIEVATSDSVKNFRYKTTDNVYYWTGQITPDSIPDGKGVARFTDGREYHGTMKRGLMESENASFKFANGDTYQGSFTADHFDNGTYTIKEDGSYFKGKFDDTGQPLRGTWYDKNGNKIQQVK